MAGLCGCEVFKLKRLPEKEKRMGDEGKKKWRKLYGTESKGERQGEVM